MTILFRDLLIFTTTGLKIPKKYHIVFQECYEKLSQNEIQSSTSLKKMQVFNKQFVVLHFRYALKLMSLEMHAIFQRDFKSRCQKNNLQIFCRKICIFLYQTLMMNGNLVPTLFLHRPQLDKITFEVAFEFLSLIDAY